jgi:hypothetical protein
MSANAANETNGHEATTAPPGEVIFARLTGPCNDSNGYPWAEFIDSPGGTWEATGRTGSVDDDPAYEVNGSTSLDGVGRVFRLTRGLHSREWRFESGAGYWI